MRRILAGCALLFAGACVPPDVAAPAAEGGELDLRGTVLTGHPARLDGEWRLWRGALLDPGSADPDSAALSTVPGGWSADPDQAHPGHGVGTYALRLHLPPHDRPMSIRAGRTYTAMRLWVDGEPVDGVGRVGGAPDAHAAALAGRVVPLPRGAEQVDLVVQVSNFDHRIGGLRRAWRIGRTDVMMARAGREILVQGLLTAFMAAMGMLSLLLWGLDRRQRAWLWFGGLALLTALRGAVGGEGWVALLLLPTMDWGAMLRLEFAANFLAPATALALVARLFPQALPMAASRVFTGVAIVLAGACAVLPTTTVSAMVPAVSAVVLASGAIGTVALVRAVRQGAPQAWPLLASVLLLVAAAAHDNLAALHVLDSPVELLAPGFLGLLATQAWAITRQFSDSVKRNEALTESLWEANATLQATHDAVIRFVPFEFLRLLGKPDIKEVERGDHVAMDVEVLFCDVRAYTTLVEGLAPSAAFGLVNDWLARMEPHVHDNGGFIKEYVGDCIVALFPHGTDAAVRAAVAMQREIREYAETQSHAPGRDFSAGMGMHTGSLVMGTIGGDSRLDTGAIGDVMNATSRIEGLTRRYGANLLLSAETLSRLEAPGELSLREVDTVKVKGKERPLTLHEVLDALPAAVRAAREGSRARFAEGRACLQRGAHAAALEAFEACLQADPSDGAAAWHRDRCVDALQARESGPRG